MTIKFTCGCGRSLRVKDEAGGRKVRCPACGNAVAVPRPETGPDAEDEALQLLLAEPDRVDAQAKMAGTIPSSEEITRPASKPAVVKPASVKTARSAAPARVESARPKPSRRRDKSKRSFSISIHPSIIAGCLMALGAVAWFVAGLSFGVIYFYPPILLCLGVGAIIRGLRGES